MLWQSNGEILYKSKFEQEVANYYGSKVKYEPDKISFEQPSIKRSYLPDFKIKENVYIEAKGKLTSEDRKKHIWVKEQHPEIMIIFLFMNSKNKLNKASKTTYAAWAESHGFPWFCWKYNKPPKTIKELIKCSYQKSLKPQMEMSNLKETSAKKKSRTSLTSELHSSFKKE